MGRTAASVVMRSVGRYRRLSSDPRWTLRSRGQEMPWRRLIRARRMPDWQWARGRLWGEVLSSVGCD